MITELTKIAKNGSEKYFSKFMNNTVVGKTMENVRKHKNIKLITTETRRNYLVSEPKYHKTKSFSKDLLPIQMKKTRTIINKPVYLGQSIFIIS